MITLGTNASALMARAATTSAYVDAATAMQRLSSGYRINAAKDDAAGVAIASRLTSHVHGLHQSVRNSMDAQSLAATADSGLQQIERSLQRIRELAVQAANDTHSDADRSNLNQEAQQLLTGIEAIASGTTWAGQTLLDGTFSNKNFHIGSGSTNADHITTSIGSMTLSALGLTSSTSILSGKKDSFNLTDGAENGYISTGFQTFLDGNRLGTVGFDDQNYDKNRAASFDLSTINGPLLSADLTLKVAPISDHFYTWTDSIYLTAFDDSGTELFSGYRIGFGSGMGPNSYFNSIWHSNTVGSGSFDIEFDLSDFSARQGTNLSLMEDLKSHRRLDVRVHDDTIVDYMELEILTSLQIGDLSSATSALTKIDSALQAVNSERANLGALSNRLDHVIANTTKAGANVIKSLGRIQDADFAAETTKLAKSQILAQASTAMLAQANASTQDILTLILD